MYIRFPRIYLNGLSHLMKNAFVIRISTARMLHWICFWWLLLLVAWTNNAVSFGVQSKRIHLLSATENEWIVVKWIKWWTGQRTDNKTNHFNSIINFPGWMCFMCCAGRERFENSLIHTKFKRNEFIKIHTNTHNNQIKKKINAIVIWMCNSQR